MKKHWVMLVAILAIVAITVPAFAVEFKYGGMYRLRWQSSDNVGDGKEDESGTIFPGSRDDNQNYMDQRLRMYFSFVGSENLQVVTKWEVDTLWGNSFDKFSTGGGVGADSINLEMKNVYVDFNIPYTPVRATLGVQGITLMTGWVIDDDFSSAKFSAKFDPIRVTIGYIAGQNNDVTTTTENIDDVFISLDYAEGPWKASLVGLFQDGHGTDVSTIWNPRMSTGSITQGGTFTFLNPVFGLVNSAGIVTEAGGLPVAGDNFLFDLGVNVGFKIDWISAYINFVKNFGSYDVFPSVTDRSVDYTGYMVEGKTDIFYGPFTFSLGGFLASGDQLSQDSDSDGNFRYPRGASHYWSEILGLGSLDQSVGGSYLNPVRAVAASTKTVDQLNNQNKLRPGDRGYQAADIPSNLWMVNAGLAYQALEKTKLTFNYYYIGTQEDVLSGFHRSGGVIDALHFDNSIGHEIDFYLDQGIVDGLNLRVVGAYLIANEGYTINNGDDDAWEAGIVLQWHF